MACKISAVICTHNRVERLTKAIESLLDQTLATTEYEIVIVDNASSDSTPAIVKACQAKHQHIRYERELELGLNPARNRGWRSATAPYVAFLDDDAIAHRQWLEMLLDAFETVTPRPAAVGGRIEPIWEAPRPAWLPDSLLDMYSICNYSDGGMFLRDVLHRQNLVGANIAFATAALNQVGGFTAGLDRVGTNLLSGGEMLLQLQLEDLGLPIYYEPRAVVDHLVPESRLTTSWLLSRCYWGGVSEALTIGFRKPQRLAERLRLSAYALRAFLLSPGRLTDYVREPSEPIVVARLARARLLYGFLRGSLRALVTRSQGQHRVNRETG